MVQYGCQRIEESEVRRFVSWSEAKILSKSTDRRLNISVLIYICFIMYNNVMNIDVVRKENDQIKLFH